MAEDFFGDLGKSISRATQNAVDRTSTFFESTKIQTQISTETKEIEKLYQKIGKSVLERAEAGGVILSDEESALAENIRNRRDGIMELKKELASVKGMKICPQCMELISAEMAFCPQCGAATPVEDDEPEMITRSAENGASEAQAGQEESRGAEETVIFEQLDMEEDEAGVEILDAEFTSIVQEQAGAAAEPAAVEETPDAEFVVLDETKP